MKVRMLDTCEDTNATLVDDGAKDVTVYNTDLLMAGQEYELPKRQAERLVAMGLAELV